MRKIIAAILLGIALFPGEVFAPTAVSDDIKKAWGALGPAVTKNYGDADDMTNRKKLGESIFNYMLGPMVIHGEADNFRWASFNIYMAEEIVENGGYFCTVEIRGDQIDYNSDVKERENANCEFKCNGFNYPYCSGGVCVCHGSTYSGNKCDVGGTKYDGGSGNGTCTAPCNCYNKKAVVTTYYEPKGIDKKCAWLCVSGKYGEKCAQDTPTKCNDTNLRRWPVALTWSSDLIESRLNGKAYLVAGVNDGGYNEEADTILMTTNWLGHGVEAEPITFTAYSSFGKVDYNGEKGEINKVVEGKNQCDINDDILIGLKRTNGTKKKLCAEGWYGPNCDLKHEFCKQCPTAAQTYVEEKGQCMDNTCGGDKTKVFNSETGACEPAQVFSYKELGAEECWPLTVASEYKKCVYNKK